MERPCVTFYLLAIITFSHLSSFARYLRMNFSKYSIRIFDLENEVKDVDNWMKISQETYLIKLPLSAEIDASRLTRSFSVTFRDVNTYTTVSRFHRITPLNSVTTV